MKKLPTLKQLQYLLALHEYQHFGRAAKACFIEQSTLSTAINELEETLGKKVIERAHKNFKFTRLGEEIVRQGRDILKQANDLMEYVRFHSGWMQGDLHLGCIPTIAPFIIEKVLAECEKNYPQLKIIWHEETTAQLLKLLEENRLDAVIIALPYPLEHAEQVLLKKDPFCLVLDASINKAFFEKPPAKWPDESLLLLSEVNCLSNQITQLCKLNTSKAINQVRAISLYTLLQLVKNKQGVTILPKMAIDYGILQGSNLISRDVPEIYRDIALVWRKTAIPNPMFKAFAEFLKEIMY